MIWCTFFGFFKQTKRNKTKNEGEEEGCKTQPHIEIWLII